MKYIERFPFFMIIVGVLGISFSAIFVRLSHAPATVTATCRLLCTVLLMTPFVLGKAKQRKALLQLTAGQYLLCILSGVFLAFHFTLWFESLNQTSVASSTAIVCTEVIWVAFGYCLFMKGRLTKKAMLCIGIALLGSFCIAFSDSASGSSHIYGDILSLLSAICVAVYTLLGKIARKDMRTTTYTYIVYVACSVTLVILTAAQKCPIQAFDARTIAVGFLLALFSTIWGHSIFSWCLKYFSPSFISASKLCEPIVAAAVAAVLFQEIPTLLQILGGIIVIAGVFLYSVEERKQMEPI